MPCKLVMTVMLWLIWLSDYLWYVSVGFFFFFCLFLSPSNFLFNLFSKMAADQNFTRGRRSELVLSSCLYLACRLDSYYRDFSPSSYIFLTRKNFSSSAGKRKLFFLLIFQATFEFPCKLKKLFSFPYV